MDPLQYAIHFLQFAGNFRTERTFDVANMIEAKIVQHQQIPVGLFELGVQTFRYVLIALSKSII